MSSTEHLHGGSSTDDLAELSGNLRLTCTVVLETDLLEHLASVLRRVLHRAHSGRLLRDGTLKESSVDGSCVIELVEVIPHLVNRW